MAKIGEPPAVRAPTKKRGWTATLPRRPPFRPSNHHHQSRDGATLTSHTSNAPPAQTGMRSLAERYRALAAAHYAKSKRRKLSAVARCERDAARVAQLTTLQSMARNTLNFCTEALQSEATNRREGEREKREAEEELRRAAGERRAAERFLSKLGIRSKKQRAEDDSMDEDEGDGENSGETENALIGGIPSKFLDLSHFPRLRKMVKRQNEAFFSPTKSDTHPSGFIDCTEEAASPARYPLRNESYPSFNSDGGLPMRIPSFGLHGEPQGIPHEVALTGNSQKGSAARVCVSRASLPHVNGTYLQEGSYNGAPLFVRVGPPRKFMGKWDCRVVLRREQATRSASGEEGRKPAHHDNVAGEGGGWENVWKCIGGGESVTIPGCPTRLDALRRDHKPVCYSFSVSDGAN
ncbi:hypothetical protein ACHAXT_012951 [Thalassiosira profunda]